MSIEQKGKLGIYRLRSYENGNNRIQLKGNLVLAVIICSLFHYSSIYIISL